MRLRRRRTFKEIVLAIEITGAYASAIIHAVDDDPKAVDEHALAQIRMLCDSEACEGSRIRVMPDVHAGNVGPIGLAMTVGSKVMPALVGNDIGCGVTVEFATAKGRIDFAKLDKAVRKDVVAGKRGRLSPIPAEWEDEAAGIIESLHCAPRIRKDRALQSLGTLGGGNHFIEIESAVDGEGGKGVFPLLVHSGSRNLGQQVFEWYMRAGQRQLRERGLDVPYEMTWLEGTLRDEYVEDVRAVCRFAELNRALMLRAICKGAKLKPGKLADGTGGFSCAHNCIDDEGLLRKGAASAREGEPVVIPANMRDGAILGIGKGNPEWNRSAPHGSGRILKRTDAKALHTVSEFKREMDGVWTSCIGQGTLDEAPFAYRGIAAIRDAIGETVEVTGILKPIYNFKTGDDD